MIERFKNHMKELKKTLSTLTWKEKIEHLVIYYYYVPIVAAGVALLVWLVVNAVVGANQETILSGTALNVRITQEGMDAIEEHLTDGGRVEGEAFLDEFVYLDVAYVELGLMDEQTATYLNTRIASQSLDYILLDQKMLDVLSVNYFIDMREIFPEEVLARWPLVYKLDPELGEEVPIGICITDTAFAEEYLIASSDLFLTATGGTIRQEEFIKLADFVLQ